ncbi:MAG: choice-of-anchor D domain-containing protein, partial [Candidatus Marinimicrobia bacterium]|nr:choice-of-anchor D domain-containing protein [Candidatus Neomarinimicrobiota bacterium]
TFWHYKYYSWASDQISVGISTTDSSVASFTFGSALTSTNAWTRHAEDLSAYAGQDIYVAINYYGAYQYYLFVDDFAGPEADVNDPGLIFSEYIEGSSNNKAIELYNASLETINLDEYQIGQTSNGSTAGVWEYFHVFPTGATLAAGDVWVIANSSTSSTYFDTSNADEVLDYPSVVHHNGDDARSILHIVGTDTVVVDLIGETGPDPGSGWDVAGVTDATKDHTLIRKADVLWGNTDWASSAGTDSVTSEWLVHDQNYFTNLGGHPGDPCWDNAITLSVSSVSYGSEISYMLTNADGDTLASCFGCMANNQTNAHDLCLTAGAYSFWGKDSYGDSWNGGSFSVTAADGAVIVAGAVESTDGTNWVEFPFAIDEPVFLAADVDFAGVVIGGSDTKSLTVTNAGYGDAATMVISAVSSDNAAFAVSGTVPATLAAGESASFSVTYTASAEGDEAAEISVMYNSDTSTVGVHGYGVDAFFFEDFDPFTGSATELPMDGWTILDNNGDADSIPQLYKTWYHDDYGVDYSGNMVAYVGYSNGYVGDESIVTPMIHLDAPSKVTFQAYDYAYNLTVGITESSTIDSSAELTTIANILVDGFYTPTYEVVLPDVDSLRVAFTLSGTAYTYFNLDNVSVVALPNTYVSGVVTDSETGAAVTAMVEFGGVSENSSATGAYGLYGAEPGVHVLNVSADGYLDSHFTLEIAEGDSLVQNVVLVAQSSAAQEVYSTGFESGEDMGWTYTGGTNPFELSAGFTFYEDYYYPDTATVA